MSMEQVAINSRIVVEEAARLTAEGYRGDAARYIEQLLIRAISSGYRRLEPVPPKGSGGSLAARKAALAATAEAVHDAKQRAGRP
ncbi:MAG TPA: hypothetical protein VFH56_16025 [Acidimicrobiales bacterium]|nr:hypothetical protein [Acidimicrobiales bacterium]